MADRSFGVREINIVGSAGTPTISSPDNINLNGNRVAISTDLQVGRNVSVVGVITANTFYGDGTNLTGVTGSGIGTDGSVNTTGVITATKFVGDGSGLTNLPGGGGAGIAGISTNGTSYFSIIDLDSRIQSDSFSIRDAGDTLTKMFFGNSGTGHVVRLYAGGSEKLTTTTTGIFVQNDVRASGIVSATSFYGDGSNLTNVGVPVGLNTTSTSFFNTIHATGTIDIGTSNAGVAVTHLSIDSADVGGTIRNSIKSGAGNTDAVLDIQTKEFLVTDPYAGKGALISADSSGTKLYKDDSVKLTTLGAGVTVTGTMYAAAFAGDGSQLTGVPISGNTGSFVRVDSQELVVSGLSTFQNNVYLGDNNVLNFGDTNDLQIYHNGSTNVFQDNGPGGLYFRSNDMSFVSTGSTMIARFTEGAEVDLYYSGSQKFNTTGYGVTVLGTTETQHLNITGVTTSSGDIHLNQDGATLRLGSNVEGDIRIYHTGSESVYWDNYGRTRYVGSKWEWTNISDTQQAAEIDQIYGVKLNYSGTRRFMTTNDGVQVAGIMTATSVSIGASNAEPNLTITSDGTDTFIKELNSTGELTISTNQLKIENPSFETLARFNENADVKLYYDNTEKLATISDGVSVSGILTVSNTTYLSTLDVSSSCSFGEGSFGRLNISGDNVNLYGNVGINTNLNVTGILTAKSLHVNSTVGDGSDRGFTTKYYVTSSGSSAYRFAGPGVLNSTNNPTLYFHRGFTYILENSTGSGHPFELRVSNGGAAYAPGGSFLTGSINGTQILTVPFDAPNSIVYQCTLHGGMVGTINFVT